MARIRTIKPQFFTSEDVTRCTRDARLLFIGLWTEADREGRLEDRPRQIKIRVFPGEDDLNVASLLEELHAAGLIDRYVVGDVAVIQITGFGTHQRPHPKEPASTLPAKSDKAVIVVKREPKVYFIRDAAKSCIKIGVSYRPDYRLAGIQTGHSTPLTLMGFCDGGFKLEKELHQKFADYRLNGEWFEESAELLRDIESKCRDQVVSLPVENPSSPAVLGREGVSIREGKESGNGTRTPVQGRGAFEPNSLPRDHMHHSICGPSMRVCLSTWECGQLMRQYGGDPTKQKAGVIAFVDAFEKSLGPDDAVGGFNAIEKNFQTWLKSIGRAPAKIAPHRDESALDAALAAVEKKTATGGPR